jgi:Divergent InlB B-repeat domain
MNGNRQLGALFLGPQTLTVNVSPPGAGTVLASGISCPGDCTETYNPYSTQTVTASAAAGFVIGGWTGCDSAAGATCTVTMGGARTVTAQFQQVFTLTASVSPAGGGSIAGPGIACPGDCSDIFVAGTSHTFTAAAAAGFLFSSWTGCDAPSGASCAMTMNAAKSLVANFSPPPPPPPPPAPFTVSLNGSAYSTGQTFVLTVALDPAISGPGPVDAYVTIDIPGGQTFSIVLPVGANRLVPGVVPIAAGFTPFAVTAPLITAPLVGIPAGTYTVQARLTQPGTSTVIGSASTVTFSFTP